MATANSRPFLPSIKNIEKAHQVLSEWISPSPLLHNRWLSEQLDCELYLKLESMLPVGSFKIRGATYKVSQLSASEKKRGVIAASAGNHAQGVAWGCKTLGVSALVVMPKNASIMKLQNTRALGAEVILAGDNYDEAFEEASKIARHTGRVFVPAYEDTDVIAGQGTLALEILAQLPHPDVVVGSIGGGGMMAGVGAALRAKSPKTTIVACQSTGAPSMIRSLKKGRVVDTGRPNTLADGIAVAHASDRMRRALSPLLDHLLEIDDDDTASAVLTLIEKAKVVAEGSAAISLAALEALARKSPKQIRGKKVVLIVCGGNIDVNLLSRIIERGLTLAGRRLRANVLLNDRPGALARLTDLIAKSGANVLQVIHDRSELSTRIDQTGVELTLETRGPKHIKELVRDLKTEVAKVQVLRYR